MPNLNAFEGKSINAIYFDAFIEPEDRKIIEAYFLALVIILFLMMNQ